MTIERIGQRYGKLVVIERLGSSTGRLHWLCQCDCGKKAAISSTNLSTGNTRSCGCFAKEKKTKHGMSKTSIHGAWRQMFNRCNNPKDHDFHNYGGRGIKVDDRWKDFSVFYEDMGNRPYGATLDRKDNEGPYCKENCKWATWREQHANKRNNRLLSAFGKTQIITVWAEEYGLPLSTLKNRLDRNGMSLEEALVAPVHKGRKLE